MVRVWVRAMGVDHGGQGEKSPQNLERGTLKQIVPPDFVI